MAEPISSTTATATLAAVSLIALFPGVSAETVLGAFAGAVVFVLSAKEIKGWLKLVFFGLSMIAGILCAPMASQLMAVVLPSKVVVSSGVGALVAAAVVIQILFWLIRRTADPDKALSEWRARK